MRRETRDARRETSILQRELFNSQFAIRNSQSSPSPPVTQSRDNEREVRFVSGETIHQNMEPSVVLHELTKRFGDFVAGKAISLEVAKG